MAHGVCVCSVWISVAYTESVCHACRWPLGVSIGQFVIICTSLSVLTSKFGGVNCRRERGFSSDKNYLQ